MSVTTSPGRTARWHVVGRIANELLRETVKIKSKESSPSKPRRVQTATSNESGSVGLELVGRFRVSIDPASRSRINTTCSFCSARRTGASRGQTRDRAGVAFPLSRHPVGSAQFSKCGGSGASIPSAGLLATVSLLIAAATMVDMDHSPDHSPS